MAMRPRDHDVQRVRQRRPRRTARRRGPVDASSAAADELGAAARELASGEELGARPAVPREAMRQTAERYYRRRVSDACRRRGGVDDRGGRPAAAPASAAPKQFEPTSAGGASLDWAVAAAAAASDGVVVVVPPADAARDGRASPAGAPAASRCAPGLAAVPGRRRRSCACTTPPARFAGRRAVRRGRRRGARRCRRRGARRPGDRHDQAGRRRRRGGRHARPRHARRRADAAGVPRRQRCARAHAAAAPRAPTTPRSSRRPAAGS